MANGTDKPSFQVIRVTQNTKVTPAGQTIPYVTVQYVVGAHGPFSVDLPAVGFSPEAVAAAVKPTVDTINALPIATA